MPCNVISTLGVTRSRDAWVTVKDVKSSLNYSLQLADLLAGLVAYSFRNSEDYEIWQQKGKPQELDLLAPRWRNRFPLLDAFAHQCVVNNLGVSFLEPAPGAFGKGLWTREPDPLRHAVTISPFSPGVH